MAIETEKAISWMVARQGAVSYSMDYRNGPSSYDCSSAIYYALMSAGAISAGWAVNTEYMHDWLIKNGYVLIAENQDWNSQRGDVVIWGLRGQSAGAGGHVVMFVDSDNIIHCNYANNGITINNYNQTAASAGWMYSYVYRLANQNSTPSTSGKTLDTLVKETLAGKYGNGDQRKAALGNQYDAVMAVINGKSTTTQKSVDQLAQEVIAGKHGNGEGRKKALGSQYDAVQKRVTEMLKTSISGNTSKTPSEPSNSVVVNSSTEPKKTETGATGKAADTKITKEDGDLSFNGVVLKKSVLDIILAKCKEHDILPSYAITVLHFEGLWGTSAVGKADNNWGGMTWTGNENRPSGITVTQGSARPSNEGGHYMHYATVDDFLTDWFYLLRAGGSYKVSGAKTFSEAVKGMFKAGGAVYDYAASGYDSYIVGMASRLKAIEQENGPLNKYDQQTDISVGQSDKIDVVIDSLEITINGVTYTATKKPI
ncbi:MULTISPECIES: peptidoglycan amidohydrolase family protein [Streptococcus]|uniref:Prophage LambdaSa2, lysin n=1 Tax=Streptococcus dysgalactiae subsp. equisimilis TaxID=119602 RepID=A0AAE9QYF5_STREQ|nr:MULTISPECIES: peptidoglycan amidohydrolase family protein [Streptococcus]HEQ3639647.1 glucosaminidase domain-containing protein [Streptococcus pyogenes]MDV6022159.1 glucosaminidase domain-containing protein [Streptococcus canis]VTT17393.1 prophage LambdaSa2, lysin [Streptococcus dysgalactiae]VTT23407.1 prophage LambdaSa2, lysin [Streptococcus dysgalactiae subsp. equisimilis]HEQ4253202.1 glucosaminidase domain-containing protein [Streptococcus pyogenes]